MGLITEKVTIKPSGRSIQYYKDKGYDVKYQQPLEVFIKDLSKGSHIKVDVQCDICGKIFKKSYQAYINSIKNFDYVCCSKCKGKKIHDYYKNVDKSIIDEIVLHRKETNNLKYGVNFPMESPEIREKSIQTNLQKYGVPNVSQNELIKEKVKQTFIERYGVDNPFKNENIKNKAKETFLKKYGVSNPFLNDEIRYKVIQSFYKNNTAIVSSQQQYFYNIIYNENNNAKLNYPISRYLADIMLNNLDIEIDYGGHILSVLRGDLSQEEFNQKELIRDKIIKSNGYKIIRIKSYNSHKVPDKKIVINILQYINNYFYNNPERTWIIFDIDNSCIYNSYHQKPDGILFDFGKLKYIK